MKKVLTLLTFISILFSYEGITINSSPSKIPYLKTFFNQYKYKLLFNEKNMSLQWIIKSSKNNILILEKHIEFMENRLSNGFIPRKWDKLFVLESKANKFIKLNIENKGDTLIITKKADNKCAFEIMKAHALVVRDEFFKGYVFKNHSEKADEIYEKFCKNYF